jgi:type II secretory pathway pseudopilin PulG
MQYLSFPCWLLLSGVRNPEAVWDKRMSRELWPGPQPQGQWQLVCWPEAPTQELDVFSLNTRNPTPHDFKSGVVGRFITQS